MRRRGMAQHRIHRSSEDGGNEHLRLYLIMLASLLLLIPNDLNAATIRVMVSGGLSAACVSLAPKYESLTGNTLEIIQGASMGASPDAIPARLDRGEAADVVIIIRSALDKLAAKGQVEKDSITDLGIGHIAMALKAGAPEPDIHTIETFRGTMLAAKSVAVTDSTGGIYVKTVLFNKLGIEKEMAAKVTTLSGVPVGPFIARGDYEIGFQQLSELKPVAGIEIVGLIPKSAQLATTFSAGIVNQTNNPAASRSLIHFLASSAAHAAIESSGLEPAQQTQ
jgi:molybdate transport system substrate-binding protein